MMAQSWMHGWLLLGLLASTQCDTYLKATPDGVINVQSLDPIQRLVSSCILAEHADFGVLVVKGTSSSA